VSVDVDVNVSVDGDGDGDVALDEPYGASRNHALRYSVSGTPISGG